MTTATGTLGVRGNHMTDDEPTIAAMQSDRGTFWLIARIGFVAAPAMFVLPLVYSALTHQWHPFPVICMTAAWAVLVSACSFAAMSVTRPGGHPWAHQAWAVPVAVIVMVPGGLLAFFLYASVVSALR